MNPTPKPPAPIMSKGTRECTCGRRISANKHYCFGCSDRYEYTALMMMKARGTELSPQYLARLDALHARSIQATDWREQLISFAYGNVRIHNPSITREMVANQLDAVLAERKAEEDKRLATVALDQFNKAVHAWFEEEGPAPELAESPKGLAA